MTIPETAFIHRVDPKNLGDRLSSPLSHFDAYAGSREVDVLDLTDAVVADLPSRVVVGGGGLASPRFEQQMRRLFSRSYDVIIGWGLGENGHADKRSGYVPRRTKPTLPRWLTRFNLLGLRDDGLGHRWVPCASCLHPTFQKERREPEFDFVLYSNENWPLRELMPDFPHLAPYMGNNVEDIDAVADFLATGRVVITNSYHGAYWAQLLGRGVLAFPFSNKFYHMRHPVTLCRPEDWKEFLPKVKRCEPALAECVAANREFHAMASWLLCSGRNEFGPEEARTVPCPTCGRMRPEAETDYLEMVREMTRKTIEEQTAAVVAMSGDVRLHKLDPNDD